MKSIAEEITAYMSKILSHPTYIGIFDDKIQTLYMDDPLKEYLDYISTFLTDNFELLAVGDHSIPISGVNLAFYKISEKTVIVLFTESGPVGQLLAFKSRMFKYADRMESSLTQVKEEIVEEKPKIIRKGPVSAERIPVLTTNIEKKKFPMDEASVLHIIDGEKTITEICESIDLPRLKVNEILKKYQKKGWIKLKRVIGTSEAPPIQIPRPGPKKVEKIPEPVTLPPKPIEIAKPIKPPSTSFEIPKLTHIKAKPVPFVPKIPDSMGASKIAIEEPELEAEEEVVYVFPILAEENLKGKIPKGEMQVLNLCDGRNTIEDILKKININRVALMNIIRKYQKKNALKLTRIIPSAPKEPVATVSQKDTSPIKESPEVLVEKVDKLLSEKVDKLLEKVEEKIAMKVSEKPPPTPSLEIPLEDTSGGDELFEETLTDLTNLLKNTQEIIKGSEESSFDETLTELSGLLDETSQEKEVSDSTILEQPLSETTVDIELAAPTSEVSEEYVPIVKGTKVTCAHCQTVLPSTKKICPQCGQAVRTCPHCNAPISIHTRICPDCSGIVG